MRCAHFACRMFLCRVPRPVQELSRFVERVEQFAEAVERGGSSSVHDFASQISELLQNLRLVQIVFKAHTHAEQEIVRALRAGRAARPCLTPPAPQLVPALRDAREGRSEVVETIAADEVRATRFRLAPRPAPCGAPLTPGRPQAGTAVHSLLEQVDETLSRLRYSEMFAFDVGELAVRLRSCVRAAQEQARKHLARDRDVVVPLLNRCFNPGDAAALVGQIMGDRCAARVSRDELRAPLQLLTAEAPPRAPRPRPQALRPDPRHAAHDDAHAGRGRAVRDAAVHVPRGSRDQLPTVALLAVGGLGAGRRCGGGGERCCGRRG